MVLYGRTNGKAIQYAIFDKTLCFSVIAFFEYIIGIEKTDNLRL